MYVYRHAKSRRKSSKDQHTRKLMTANNLTAAPDNQASTPMLQSRTSASADKPGLIPNEPKFHSHLEHSHNPRDSIELPASTPMNTILHTEHRSDDQAPVDASDRLRSSPTRSRRDAERDIMRMLGLPDVRAGPAATALKKAQRCEATASREAEWISAKGANSQKHDQLMGRMHRGRQNHKLMPR